MLEVCKKFGQFTKLNTVHMITHNARQKLQIAGR